MAATMKISVVICTLNEEQYISKILQDLHNQLTKPNEILVVDADSQDRTQLLAKKFPLTRVLVSHSPVGHQRSFGGKTACGDVLFFFDADVRIHPSFISDSLYLMQERRLDIACPYYLSPGAQPLTKIFLRCLNVIFILLQKVIPSGGGNCIIVKKKTFEAVGGFDKTIQCDDIEFIRRAAHVSRFGIIPTKCYISDRRFRKYGFWHVFVTYALLSIFFTFGLFKYTGRFIRYEFGKFNS